MAGDARITTGRWRAERPARACTGGRPRRAVAPLVALVLVFALGLFSPSLAAGAAARAQAADQAQTAAPVAETVCDDKDNACWMAKYADYIGQRPLSQVIMPFSHDAATYDFPALTYPKNQDDDLLTQLKYGARGFDIRARATKEYSTAVEYHIYHGDPCCNSKIELKTVLGHVKEFVTSPGAEREIVYLKFTMGADSGGPFETAETSRLLSDHCDTFASDFGGITLSPAMLGIPTDDYRDIRTLNEIWALPGQPRVIVEWGACFNLYKNSLGQTDSSKYWQAQDWFRPSEHNGSYYANALVQSCMVDGVQRALYGRLRTGDGGGAGAPRGCDKASGMGTPVKGLYISEAMQSGIIPGLGGELLKQDAVVDALAGGFRTGGNPYLYLYNPEAVVVCQIPDLVALCDMLKSGYNARAHLNYISGDFVTNLNLVKIIPTAIGLNLPAGGDEYAGGPRIAVYPVDYGDRGKRLEVFCRTTRDVGLGEGALSILTSEGGPTSPDMAGDQTTISVDRLAGQQVFQCKDKSGRVARLVFDGVPAEITLGNLSHTYDGTAKAATATTSPAGLGTIGFTYTGVNGTTYPTSSTPPTNAGDYTVVATLDNPQYAGSATGTLTIAKAAAVITLGDLVQAYDGQPKQPTVTTTPAGLQDVSMQYSGIDGTRYGPLMMLPPSAIGTYQVDAGLLNPNYTGRATGTLRIGKPTAAIALGNLAQTYDGTPKAATATTTPADLPGLTITYTGTGGTTYGPTATAPTGAGAYSVVATLDNATYEGATGTLTVDKAASTTAVTVADATYDGQPHGGAAAVSGAGGLQQPLAVSYSGRDGTTYGPSATPPTGAGNYTANASFPGDANHTGSADSKPFTIARAASTTTVSVPTGAVYDGTAKAATAQTTGVGGAVIAAPAVGYTPGAGAPVNAGDYTASASFPGDANYLPSTDSKRFTIAKAALQVRADDLIKVLGAANPPLTATITGFVAGETTSVLSGSPALSTTATTASGVGSYPIVAAPGTLAAANYTFTFVNGTLAVQYAAGGNCLGAPGHAVLQPVNADGTSVFKQRSTVPVKFRVCDANGASIGTPGVVADFRLVQITTGTTSQAVNEPVDSTTPHTAFRWDAGAQQWIFNLSTKDLAAGSTYTYRIPLDDGTAITFQFGLR